MSPLLELSLQLHESEWFVHDLGLLRLSGLRLGSKSVRQSILRCRVELQRMCLSIRKRKLLLVLTEARRDMAKRE